MDEKCPHEQPPVGRARRVHCGKPVLRGLQIDLVAEVVVRDLTFRAGHRCGYGAPHLGHVEAWLALPSINLHGLPQGV